MGDEGVGFRRRRAPGPECAELDAEHRRDRKKRLAGSGGEAGTGLLSSATRIS
jgi:hypothetical protein